MSEFFMLESYGILLDGEPSSVKSVSGAEGRSWLLGREISPAITEPIRVILDPGDGVMMPLYKGGILLFSDELIGALNAAGVNNMHYYAVELSIGAGGRSITDYKAVNIIGIVAAADLGASDCVIHGQPIADVDFDGLVLDESKTCDFLMFRLAECVTGIVVHESVKDYVERQSIPNLDWIAPADWVG